MSMKKRVLVVLATGFEEVEAVTPIDVLRRAGFDVTVAGVGSKTVEGAHGLRVEADTEITKTSGPFDAIVLPGGMPGAQNLAQCEKLSQLLQEADRSQALIAAICASPAVVLASKGFLAGRKATCYPGFESQFGSKTTFVSDRVVADGHILTSRGPGTALEFSFTIVERLAGAEEAAKLSKGMIANPAR